MALSSHSIAAGALFIVLVANVIVAAQSHAQEMSWSSIALAKALSNLQFSSPHLEKQLCGNSLEALLHICLKQRMMHTFGLMAYIEMPCTSTSSNELESSVHERRRKGFKIRNAVANSPEKGYDPSLVECLHLFKLEAIEREDALLDSYSHRLAQLSYTTVKFPRGLHLDNSQQRFASSLCVSDYIPAGVPLQYHIAGLKTPEEVVGIVLALLDMLDALSNADIIHRDVHYDNIVVRRLSNQESQLEDNRRQKLGILQSSRTPSDQTNTGSFREGGTTAANQSYYQLILLDFTWATSPGIRNYAAVPPYLNDRYSFPAVTNHSRRFHDDVYSVGLLLQNVLTTLVEIDISWMHPLIEVMTTTAPMLSIPTIPSSVPGDDDGDDDGNDVIYRSDASGYHPPHRLQHSRRTIKKLGDFLLQLYSQHNEAPFATVNSSGGFNGIQQQQQQQQQSQQQSQQPSAEELRRQLLCNQPNMYAAQLSLKKLFIVPQDEFGQEESVLSPYAIVDGYQHFEMANFYKAENGSQRDSRSSSIEGSSIGSSGSSNSGGGSDKSLDRMEDFSAVTLLSPLSPGLKTKDQILRPLIEHVARGLTVFDVGGNMGFFSARAVQYGARRSVVIDMDSQYTAAAADLYAHMGAPFADRISVVNSRLGDVTVDMMHSIDAAATDAHGGSVVNNTSSDYFGIQEDSNNELAQADMVIALALVHWSYNCSETHGSLARTIGALARRTRKWLIIEWIAPDDGAIKFANHLGHSTAVESITTHDRTDSSSTSSSSSSSNDGYSDRINSPYTQQEFVRVLQSLFACVRLLGSVSDSRAIYFAMHRYTQSPHDPVQASEEGLKVQEEVIRVGSRVHQEYLAVGSKWTREQNYCWV